MTIKKAICGALVLVSVGASAAEFSPFVEAGVTQFGDQGNGIWYQKGLPYDLKLTSPMLKLGVRVSRLSFGYAYLGRAKTDCLCTPTDANYSLAENKLIDPSEPLTRFKGSGHVHGAFADLRLINVGPLFAEAGALVYWQKWKVRVGDESNPWHTPEDWNTGSTFTVKADSNVRVTPTLAVGLEHGHWSVRASRYFSVHGSEPFIPVWKNATVVSVRYVF